MVVPVSVLSCCCRFALYVGGAFPLTSPHPPSGQVKQRHGRTRPHCHPLPWVPEPIPPIFYRNHLASLHSFIELKLTEALLHNGFSMVYRLRFIRKITADFYALPDVEHIAVLLEIKDQAAGFLYQSPWRVIRAENDWMQGGRLARQACIDMARARIAAKRPILWHQADK